MQKSNKNDYDVNHIRRVLQDLGYQIKFTDGLEVMCEIKSGDKVVAMESGGTEDTALIRAWQDYKRSN